MLAMETEELLRSHPVDAVVLMGGCDKTTPGLLLGAALCTHCVALGWVRKVAGTRAVEVTPLGLSRLREMFGLRVGD